MKIVSKPNHSVLSLTGSQRFVPDTLYRRTSFCTEIACSEGKLLYHSLTGELLLLEGEESIDSCELREYLVCHWFLVLQEHDEVKFCEQIKTVARLIQPDNTTINKYTIFTTTDCNARCYYCFERGQRRVPMTEKTAKDVAQYIIKNAERETVKIRWFGGEPLFNARVIDIISQELQTNDLNYEADMVSNAFLFEEDIVQKAISLWHLRRILITLDGTEKIYNRTKNYIYHECNAFQKVIANIQGILEAGITAVINLNMDASNKDDLLLLADDLGHRFGTYPNFYARAGLLVEYVGKIHHFGSELDALNCLHTLNDRLASNGIKEKKYLASGIVLNSCMADDPHAVTILPDGRIGRCEHFGDSEEVGSIYSSTYNLEKLNSWQELRAIEENCRKCVLYPQCLRLKKCNSSPAFCNQLFRSQLLIDLWDRMKTTYEKWALTSNTEHGGN